jgi:hypothetical protein
VIQRSNDGGKTWETPGGKEMPKPDSPPAGKSNKFVYDTSAATGKPLTTHQWYDGTQHPWEFKRVWHLEPSLTNPDEVYAGVEDAALFRSTDGAHRHVVPPSSVRSPHRHASRSSRRLVHAKTLGRYAQ